MLCLPPLSHRLAPTTAIAPRAQVSQIREAAKRSERSLVTLEHSHILRRRRKPPSNAGPVCWLPRVCVIEIWASDRPSVGVGVLNRARASQAPLKPMNVVCRRLDRSSCSRCDRTTAVSARRVVRASSASAVWPRGGAPRVQPATPRTTREPSSFVILDVTLEHARFGHSARSQPNARA